MERYDLWEAGDDICQINGEHIEGDRQDCVYHFVEEELLSISHCPFCSTAMLSAVSEIDVPYVDATKEEEENDGVPESHEEDYADSELAAGMRDYLYSCPNCSYWHWYHRQFSDGFPTSAWSDAYIAKARDFANDLPPGCEADLAQGLRRNHSLWHGINPTALERFVASIFKANHTDCEVFHVGRPHDRGVDVVFVDSNKKQWLIQVKRRTRQDASEGFGTVVNLLGTLDVNKSKLGILVSTVDHFTYRAYEAAGLGHASGKVIELVDRGKLNRMLSPLIPDRPWRGVLSKRAPYLLGDFEVQIPSVTEFERIIE